MAANFKAEVERAISLIPELPDGYDDSELSERMENQRELIESLQSLVVAENLRNALEALPEGDKLAIEAIEGLREELNRLAKNWGNGKGGGLGQGIVLDLIRESVANGTIPSGSLPDGGTTGQVLRKQSNADGDADWETIGGTGIVETIVAGTGITVDSTDPANPIVSATASAPAWGDITGTLSNQTDLQTALNAKAPAADPTFTTKITTPVVRASTSAGLLIEANSGTDVVDFGAGGGSNATFFGGVNIDGATRLATSLTGPLRADSGVVSVGTDNAGITRSIVVTSGSVTAGSTALVDYVYLVAGAHTISLPAASGNTNLYTIKNNHSANITIDTVGSETIDGTASISIAPEESVNIISNGTNFNIV
jgi:hypothetical protein